MGDLAAEPEEQRGGEAVADHEDDRAGDADDVPAGDAEKEVAHVHDAGKADHEGQFLLGEGDETGVEEIADEQREDERQASLEAVMEHRDGDPDQAVDGEFLQDAGVEHGGGGRRGGISGRRPGMEREKSDENAEADEQEREDDVLRRR